mmetsp:Transcript_19441/g.46420  ORF Transcript_19441/g.46420 Transcript_19441/m.46420 type:complete len:211 (-) Transcript_19441:1101-1733(-)
MRWGRRRRRILLIVDRRPDDDMVSAGEQGCCWGRVVWRRWQLGFKVNSTMLVVCEGVHGRGGHLWVRHPGTLLHLPSLLLLLGRLGEPLPPLGDASGDVLQQRADGGEAEPRHVNVPPRHVANGSPNVHEPLAQAIAVSPEGVEVVLNLLDNAVHLCAELVDGGVESGGGRLEGGGCRADRRSLRLDTVESGLCGGLRGGGEGSPPGDDR